MILNKQLQSRENSWRRYNEEYSHQENISELEVSSNGAIYLPKDVLDKLDWKSKSKLAIVDDDYELHQITIGKQLTGKEFVESLNKLRDRF